jgi:mutator protein MutT
MALSSSPSAIEVAAALVFHRGRLLITQRPPGSHLEGLWEFPGGKREPGETFEQCLQRELREELDMEVAVGPFVESVRHSYPSKTVDLRFYQCEWVKGQPRPIGCSAFAWVSPAELRAYQLPPADEQLIGRLERDVALWR